MPRFHHAALPEQFCPAAFISINLSFTETKYEQFSLKGRGSVREAEACREDQAFPTCSPV